MAKKVVRNPQDALRQDSQGEPAKKAINTTDSNEIFTALGIFYPCSCR